MGTVLTCERVVAEVFDPRTGMKGAMFVFTGTGPDGGIYWHRFFYPVGTTAPAWVVGSKLSVTVDPVDA